MQLVFILRLSFFMHSITQWSNQPPYTVHQQPTYDYSKNWSNPKHSSPRNFNTVCKTPIWHACPMVCTTKLVSRISNVPRTFASERSSRGDFAICVLRGNWRLYVPRYRRAANLCRNGTSIRRVLRKYQLAGIPLLGECKLCIFIIFAAFMEFVGHQYNGPKNSENWAFPVW